MDIMHVLKEDGYYDGLFLDKNIMQFGFMKLIQVRNVHSHAQT